MASLLDSLIPHYTVFSLIMVVFYFLGTYILHNYKGGIMLSWIIVGGFAGWIASKIMGKDKSMGILANIITGIVGALIGGYIMNLAGGDPVSLASFNLYSFLVSIGGAVLVLFVLNKIRK